MKQLSTLFLVLMTLVSWGQDLPKEKLYESKKQLRAGNKAYQKNKYADAAIAYQKSLAEDGTYYKGAYNLGNAYFNQKKYKEAVEQYQLANKLAKTKVEKAKTQELIGDAFKKQKDLEKALNAYKQALLKNPKDDILRQKFIAAKQEKQKQDQQNKDKKDNKDDKNKDQKDQNKDNKDQKDSDKNKDGDKDQKNKDGEKDKDKNGDHKDDKEKGDEKDQNSDQKDNQKGEEKEQPASPRESKLSPQQMQQLLESMSNEEQKTQKKVNAQQVKVKTNKNEKDW